MTPFYPGEGVIGYMELACLFAATLVQLTTQKKMAAPKKAALRTG